MNEKPEKIIDATELFTQIKRFENLKKFETAGLAKIIERMEQELARLEKRFEFNEQGEIIRADIEDLKQYQILKRKIKDLKRIFNEKRTPNHE